MQFQSDGIKMSLHTVTYKEPHKSPLAISGSTPGGTIPAKTPFSIEDILFQNGANNNNNSSSTNFNVKPAGETKLHGTSPGSQVIDSGGSNSSSSVSLDSCAGTRKVPQFVNNNNRNVNGYNNSGNLGANKVIGGSSSNSGNNRELNGPGNGEEDYRKAFQQER